MAEFSTDQVSRDLVRHLRGGRSQPAFSKLVGFGSNVVYTWESGRRSPETSSFFRAARVAKVPVHERIVEFIPEASSVVEPGRIATPRAVQHIVRLLVGRAPKRELARRIGVDRTTLARWLAGNAEPRLPEFLRLVDVTTQRLLQFIGLFASPADLPSTQAAYRDLQAQQKLAFDLPWSHAVLRALELSSYDALDRHVPGCLGRHIGIDADEEQRYLDELAAAGQIRWEGSHWSLHRVLTVDTRVDPEQNRRLKAHWARIGLERLESGSAPGEALFSFNLFAISERSFQKIRELHLDYYDRVRAIVDESTTADRVVLMNLQLLPMGSESSKSG
jgi:transcriptional regulator with XRE-family HTH domain